MGREPRALRAERLLENLHEHLLALAHEVADVGLASRGHGLVAVARDGGTRDVRSVQERRPFEAELDERRLHSRQHARHLSLIDIADQAAPAGALDQDFLQHTALDERRADLARRRVDEDLLAFHRAAAAACGRALGRARDAPERHAAACEQRGRLEQRQAHDAGIAARQMLDEHGRPPLNTVPARLVERLAAATVRGTLGARRGAKSHFAARQQRLGRVAAAQRDRSQHAMRAARQRREHRFRLGLVGRLTEHALVEHDGRVGGEHRPALAGRDAPPNGIRLLRR